MPGSIVNWGNTRFYPEQGVNDSMRREPTAGATQTMLKQRYAYSDI